MINKVIVIPARYESKRLPGKPLIKLVGKEMLLRTYERCIKTSLKDYVYVATDSSRIYNFCKSNNIKVEMTSNQCLTGTDRIAEFSKIIKANHYINVQGDEPIIPVSDIQKVIDNCESVQILAGFSKIKSIEMFKSSSIPKMVFDKKYNLLYTSRSPIPGSKNIHNFDFGYKQVCVYSFSYESLRFIEKNPKKEKFEKIEDLELLRFIENNIEVKLIELSGEGIAVDTKEDVKNVTSILLNEKN